MPVREGLLLRTLNQGIMALITIPLFFLIVLLLTGVIVYFWIAPGR